MKSKISIVIPCYNDESFIDKAVHSALNQTYSNIEVIVVDDGSNFKTKQVLEDLKLRIDLLITQENKGVSAARNAGIAAADGEYILVLDSDDYFEPTYCKKAIDIFETAPDVKLVTCYARWFKNEKDFQIFQPQGGDLKEFLTTSCALSNSLFKKLDWKNHGGYDEAMVQGWEDWEFFIRLHSDGGFTYVIPEVLFNYRKRAQSKTTIANQNKYNLLQYIYFKHLDIYQIHIENSLINLFEKLKKEEKEKIKIKESIEFKLGNLLLKPIKKLKSIFTFKLN